MRRLTRRSWLHWFLVAALVLMGNAFIFYESSIRLNEQNRQVSHAHDVLAALDSVLAGTDDAETGQRGYILTGNTDYLQPYTRAAREIEARLARLRALTADDPYARTEIARIDRDVHAKFAVLARTIALRRGGDAGGAYQIVLTGSGESLMQSVRSRIARMQATENATLVDRQRTAEQSARALDVALAAATTASILLLGLLGYFAWRRTERREREAAERAELLRREQVARTQAEEAVMVRNQFLIAVSHELNTPLAALIGGVQLLERHLGRTDLGRQERPLVDVVVTQTNRLRAMVHTLLDVARMQSGQFTLQIAPIDFSAVVERALLAVQPALAGRRVTTHSDAGDLIVLGDDVRLQQVLDILLRTVAHYAQADGTLDVLLAPIEGMLVLTIRGDGAAIPAEALPSPQRGGRNVEGSDSRQVQDVGMSLYIADEIIRTHGGALDIRSSEATGTTITIRLPAGAATTPEQQAV